jgi:hypothetical protein
MITTVLADNFDNLGDGLAGPMGLLIIVLLGIATVLLIRNMNSRLRRLPDRFPAQGEQSPPSTGPTSRSTTSADGPSADP